MIPRRLQSRIADDLSTEAAVVLLGPRQSGKTTLALGLGETMPSLYLDLEQPADRAKLADPQLFLGGLEDRLVILDEVQNVPELFAILRGLIDQGRRRGRDAGRFLLLGSASVDLLRQTSESLAGRAVYRELAPLDVLEIEPAAIARDELWLRGGFPRSLIAPSARKSFERRRSFIRTYLERDIPAFSPRAPAETLRRLWTMLAHNQGQPLNASRLASSLGVSSPAVSRTIDLLVDLLLVRRLAPFHANLGKRLVKSPKVYIRDSGVLHALLDVVTRDALFGHPVIGPSWEGFVIETLCNLAGPWTHSFYYRTSAGAEIDLVLERPGGEKWAIEVKHGLVPKLERGFHLACEDLKPARRYVVTSGEGRYPMSGGVEAIGLAELAGMVAT